MKLIFDSGYDQILILIGYLEDIYLEELVKKIKKQI